MQDAPRISARVVALLAEAANLRRLRIAYRHNPEVYAELLAITAIALASPENRTELAVRVDLPALSEMTTTETAAQLHITESGVLKAIAAGRLDARKRGGRWMIPTDSITRYRAA